MSRDEALALHWTPAGPVSAGGAGLGLVRGGPALVQSIRMLVGTRPGERGLRPDFGCPLDRLLFEPNDDTTAGLAMQMVADAIAAHLPHVAIDRLDASADPDAPGRLVIALAVSDRRTGKTGALAIPVDLGGDPP